MLLDFYKQKEQDWYDKNLDMETMWGNAYVSFTKLSGFSVLTADELYYVNGGSFSWSGRGSAVAVGAGTGAMTGIGVVTGAIAGWVGGFITGGFGW